MKFLGLEFGTRRKDAVVQVTEAEAAPPKSAAKDIIRIIKAPRLRNPTLVYRNGIIEFERPEYDLAEIGKIEDVESYVQRAFTLKEGLMFKEGWELVGKNRDAIQYVKRRFQQMSLASSVPFALTLRGIGEDIIRFSNAYVIKVRNDKASGGRVRKGQSGREFQPVAGYFGAHPATIRIKRDDNGKILQYRQELPNGKYQEFSPENVIHFFFRKKKGFTIGTPALVAVKDDIRALRRIEENVELLVYQSLFPLYQYTVGTLEAPSGTYSDGRTEIEVVQSKLESMPSEGMIVTPERHTITAIGAEGKALKVESYLDHFKKRVFAGLGCSAVDFGEGETANRATADNMSRNMVDDVKHFQEVLEIFINEFMINELLLESDIENPLDDANIVTLRFKEIDVDAKIKQENHAIQAFSGHAITQTELRSAFGKEPLTEEEWQDTYWKKIMEPENLIRAVDEPYSVAAKAAVANPNTAIEQGDVDKSKEDLEEVAEKEQEAELKKQKAKATTKTAGQRAAAGKDRPSNQHGTKLSPEKRKSSVESGFVLTDAVKGDHLETLYNDLFSNTMHLITTDGFARASFQILVNATQSKMTQYLQDMCRDEFNRGATHAYNTDLSAYATYYDELNRRSETIIKNFMTALERMIQVLFNQPVTITEALIKVPAIFDSLRYRNMFIMRTEAMKAYNYGIAKALRLQGRTVAKIDNKSESCEECQDVKEINLESAGLDEVPAFHPNCKCVITLSKD